MNKVDLALAHRDAIRGPPAGSQNKTAAWRMRCLDRGRKERPRSIHAGLTGNCNQRQLQTGIGERTWPSK
ncbi:MAG: hypothetical protein OEY03_18005 [Rhizobacter sp.]|nr:hypothetical protein [Rhizobacter sp.]